MINDTSSDGLRLQSQHTVLTASAPWGTSTISPPWPSPSRCTFRWLQAEWPGPWSRCHWQRDLSRAAAQAMLASGAPWESKSTWSPKPWLGSHREASCRAAPPVAAPGDLHSGEPTWKRKIHGFSNIYEEFPLIID